MVPKPIVEILSDYSDSLARIAAYGVAPFDVAVALPDDVALAAAWTRLRRPLVQFALLVRAGRPDMARRIAVCVAAVAAAAVARPNERRAAQVCAAQLAAHHAGAAADAVYVADRIGVNRRWQTRLARRIHRAFAPPTWAELRAEQPGAAP